MQNQHAEVKKRRQRQRAEFGPYRHQWERREVPHGEGRVARVVRCAKCRAYKDRVSPYEGCAVQTASKPAGGV